MSYDELFKQAICKCCGTLLKIIPTEDYDRRIKELGLEDIVKTD